MKIAALLSVLLHAAGLGALHVAYQPAPPAAPHEPPPMVLDLQPETPPEPQPPRALVDVAVPATTPPPPTDRIAETHAEAMDLAARPSDTPAPQLEQDDFDALPKEASPPPAAAPPNAPPPPEPATEERSAPDKEAEARPVEERPQTEPAETPEESTEPAEPAPEAPIRIARRDAALPERPTPGRSRERTGVSKQGATNFDAIQSEIAPYLKKVRQQVELRWNEMLYTRYSGTSPAKAVIDCAINPQGELVAVTIVGGGGDRLYSALCKDAVERAGPFGPFPFTVPDIYKEKNLEIRWTFNFL